MTVEVIELKTVHEVSRLTGVTVRALQYYDRIGLLSPSNRTEAGYRLYDDEAILRLGQILLFRELEFPLREIKRILDSPNFDREAALEQQIELLTLKKEHLENIIKMAENVRNGGKNMDFKAFDTSKMDEYARGAKERWGGTEQYGEYVERSKNRTPREEKALGGELMEVFARFGRIKDTDPAGGEAQSLVSELKAFITKRYYNCTDEILGSLGQMYAAGGEFTENIDSVGGEGTAVFVNRAIEAYRKK